MADFDPRHKVATAIPIDGGVNFIRPSVYIKDNEAADLSNFDIRGGRVTTRLGLADLTDTAITVTKPIMGLHPAFFPDGTLAIVIHTADKVHTWTGASLVDRTGTAITSVSTDRIPWTACIAQDNYFACNGVNELIYWDGQAATFSKVSAHPDFDGVTPIGKHVTAFAGRVILGNTVESQPHQNRLRWSGNTFPFDWNSANETGAGAVDLADTPGRINGFVTLNDQLIVLKDDAIVIGRESGNPDSPIIFPTYLRIGCLSGRSAQPIDPNSIVFLSPDNVYMLSGGQTKAIGDRIIPDLFSRIDYNRLDEIHSWIEADRSFYCLAIPERDTGAPRRVYVYNWLEDLWTVRDYAFGGLSATYGGLSVGTSYAWNSFGTATFQDPLYATRAFSSFNNLSSDPVVYVGGTYQSGGVTTYRLGKLDKVSSDFGIPFSVRWRSKFLRLNPQGWLTVYAIRPTFSSTSEMFIQHKLSSAMDDLELRTSRQGRSTVYLPPVAYLRSTFPAEAFVVPQQLPIRTTALGVQYEFEAVIQRRLTTPSTNHEFTFHHIDFVWQPRRSVRL